MRAFPVVEAWFEADDLGDDVTCLTEAYVDDLIRSNVWHIRGRDRDLVVDTGNGIGDLGAAIAPLAAGRPVIAVATHAHFDHVGGLAGFDDRRCHAADADETRAPYPMRIHRSDFPDDAEEMFATYGQPTPDAIVRAIPSPGFDADGWVSPGAVVSSFVGEGDVIDLGDRALEVLHVPGHTPGSVALWEPERGLLFTGDTLYDGPMDFEDRHGAIASLRRLRALPALRIHGGHDPSFDGARMRELIDAELARLG
jgi:glyoxylase-like metal-dependent hydrolase (beta-lactamase superfamily II)